MRLFPPEPVIGDKEGFSKDKDLFGRASLGEGLKNLVRVVTQPTVIAIDGPWGTGKTVFLKMWAGELRKAGFPVVYFDAFANDFVDDPFTALAGEVIELIEEKKASSQTAAQKFRAKALDVGKVLIRGALHAGVKIATMNAIDGKDLKELGKVAAEELAEAEDKLIGEAITRHKEQKLTFEAFREALSDLPSILIDPETAAGDPRPLVFIVDELDRCRPIFALSLLERIKHFFAVPGVHFVLGAHLRQLRNSVVAAYGSGIDATTYLEKFIQVTVHLSDPGRAQHERVYSKYLDLLLESVDFPPSDRNFMAQSVRFILHVGEQRELGFRTLERIATTLSLAMAFFSSGGVFVQSSLICGLAIIKVTDPDLYSSLRAGSLSISGVSHALCLDKLGKDDRELLWHLRWWRFYLDTSLPQTDVQEISAGSFFYRDDSERLTFVRKVIVEMMDPVSQT